MKEQGWLRIQKITNLKNLAYFFKDAQTVT